MLDYMNRETGEILTYSEMKKQFMEEYDGGDDTNLITLGEIYVPVIFVDGSWLYVLNKTATHYVCSRHINRTKPLVYIPRMCVV